MPIIAGRASAAYGAGFAAVTTVPFAPIGAFDALSTVIVPSGGLESITFAGIPQTGYSHLQIRATIGRAAAGNNQLVLLRFNGDPIDVTGKYKIHHLYGLGSGIAATDFNNSTSGSLGLRADNSTNTFMAVVADILDYNNTSKNTTVRSFWGFDTNGVANSVPQLGNVGITSTLYKDTSSINRITIQGFNANVFPEYSKFSLYGVK
jgi:hypothetical protein